MQPATRGISFGTEEVQQLLLRAGHVLASSLDYETTVANVARLAIPILADSANVYLVEEGRTIRWLATAHARPTRERLHRRIQRRFPTIPLNDAHPVAEVVRTGRSVVRSEMPDSVLVAVARDAEHLELLRRLGICSTMSVPLAARDRTFGVITFLTAESGRRYGSEQLAVAEDLARRCALAIDNARLYREAQESIRHRDEFLSIASHELRTPITVVKGHAQLLLRLLDRGSLDEERLRRALHGLVEGSDRLATLVHDLLDVSRLQRGQLDLQPVAVELGPLAARIVALFHDQVSSTHHVVTRSPADPVVITADPFRLGQVLTNLLDNAIKHSPRGGEVTISVERDPADGALVRVRDRGIGVPADMLEAIFRPFGRAANAEAIGLPGMGLGLYICRRIIERHGGRAWAESEGEGLGTTISFWLPSSPAPPPELPVAAC